MHVLDCPVLPCVLVLSDKQKQWQSVDAKPSENDEDGISNFISRLCKAGNSPPRAICVLYTPSRPMYLMDRVCLEFSQVIDEHGGVPSTKCAH